MRSARLSPLSDRDFTRFFGAHVVSFFGTRISYVVLPVLIFEVTGSALHTALVLVLETAPYLVLGLLAGAVADRLDRRRIMVACELTGFVLTASIPLSHYLGMLSVGQIYVVAAGTAVCFVWFDAANFGALSTVAGRQNLVRARSLIQATDSTIMIIGPAAGGLLIAALGSAQTIILDAASYLISAILLLTVGRQFHGPRPVERTNYRADIAAGIRYLWTHRIIRSLTVMGFGNSFAAGAAIGLLVVFANNDLRIDSDQQIGFLFAAGAVGSLIASLSLPWLLRRASAAAVGLCGISAAGLLLVGFSLTTSFLWAFAAYLLWNAAYSCTVLNGIIYQQRVVPDELQGRVNVIARMIAWGGQPAGGLVAGLQAQIWGVRAALLTAAAVVLVTAGAAWLGPLHRDAHLIRDTAG